MGSVKAEIIKLGCLRFNGKPVSPGVRYNMETISFGDTDPEKAISFVKWKNLLVADRCIFTSISWNDLNHSGLIFGRPVKIDGDPYICRSLRVGKEEGSSNEWDAILDDLEESDDLWHWDYIYFWGQENEKNMASNRAVRGSHSARSWGIINATYRDARVGFRPALEPLPPEPLVSEPLIGANLEIYGQGYMFDGKLVDFSDYDLIISPPGGICSAEDKCGWASMVGDNVVIDRSAITWMKEVD